MKCNYCQKDVDSSNTNCPVCGTELRSGTTSPVKPELSNEEKAAKKVVNHITLIVIFVLVAIWMVWLSNSYIAEYRAKKQLELLDGR